MKKLFFALLLAPGLAGAQSVKYEIDMVRKDSFFLVETVIMPPTAGNPRGQTVVNSQLFRSMEQLELFQKRLAEEADKYAAVVQDLRTRSKGVSGVIEKQKKKKQ